MTSGSAVRKTVVTLKASRYSSLPEKQTAQAWLSCGASRSASRLTAEPQALLRRLS